MKVNLIAIFVYVALVILTSYNIYLNWQLSKKQNTIGVRTPDDLSTLELQNVASLRHAKRRWSIASNLFLLIALALAFVGTIEQLAYFVDLYTICNILVVKYNQDIFEVVRYK